MIIDLRSESQVSKATVFKYPLSLPAHLFDLIVARLTIAQPLLTQNPLPIGTTGLDISRSSTNILNAHLGLRKRIRRVPISRDEIDTNGIRIRRDEEAQRHQHAELGIVSRIRRGAQDRGHDGTTTDGADDPAGTALGVFSQPAHSQRHDGWETDAFEEEDDEEHGDARVAGYTDGGCDENDAQAEVGEENPAGTDEAH